ncbi:PEBP family protein [Roseibium sediminicola]|uniref:PEBP family protein n=1 Tax=Roseibium sediminicola TaxID=2933272 RepID=A0ABT0GMR3_9HYPH|nr:PEBP family protein [Roseibium sp. CAU 1639]MCK7610713.1 PEBP family protein [Roseibium sp. CAU 1639]
MTLSARHAAAVLLSLAVGLAAVPSMAFAQKPPPPPGHGDGKPPPRPGDGNPPPRRGDGPPPRPGGGGDVHESAPASSGARTIVGEVWVDNWFRLYVNGVPLVEDSVAYKSERSFNAERFRFNADLPMTLAFEFRDFMENETGLEYIGTRRQQMGDGGAIAQFKDAASGKVLAVTSRDWRCLTVQAAPANASCADERKPDVSKANCAPVRATVASDWMAPGFDDSAWPKASLHSARDVGPKGGYDRIDWDRSAKLIWGPDLKKDNILYCRLTVGG